MSVEHAATRCRVQNSSQVDGHGAIAFVFSTTRKRCEREWNIRKTIENGWSRAVLVHWIESDLYKRQGKAPSNFDRTLPPPQSDLARETLKDPYNFEFLSLASVAEERMLQKGLLEAQGSTRESSAHPGTIRSSCGSLANRIGPHLLHRRRVGDRPQHPGPDKFTHLRTSSTVPSLRRDSPG